MRLRYAARTELGSIRERNEDNYLIDPKLQLFIVADGIGGGPRGDVASALATKLFRSYLKKNIDTLDRFRRDPSPSNRDEVRTLMRRAAMLANQGLFAQAKSHPELKGMGTTLTSLLIIEGHAFCVHVGDSRLYRLRGDSMVQLTIDHVLSEALDAEGEDEGDEHQDLNNTVLEALGTSTTPSIHELDFALELGDGILLCTDGLYRYLDGLELQTFLDAFREIRPESVVSQLAQYSVEQGGEDNITAIWVEVVSGTPTSERPGTVTGRFLRLQAWPLFMDLSNAHLRTISEALRPIDAPEPGQILVESGQPGPDLILIMDGSVETIQQDRFRRIIPAGNLLGVEQILGPGPATSTIRVLQPGKFLALPPQVLRDMAVPTRMGGPEFLLRLSEELTAWMRHPYVTDEPKSEPEQKRAAVTNITTPPPLDIPMDEPPPLVPTQAPQTAAPAASLPDAPPSPPQAGRRAPQKKKKKAPPVDLATELETFMWSDEDDDEILNQMQSITPYSEDIHEDYEEIELPGPDKEVEEVSLIIQDTGPVSGPGSPDDPDSSNT